MVKAIIFDFGGVLSDEGFRNGLTAIARQNGLDTEAFFQKAKEMIYEAGYVTGRVDERAYWEKLREETGIKGHDAELREAILTRFVLRPRMIEEVDRLRSAGYLVVLLSDQTNWLDELDEGAGIYRHFDYVFNSFKMGISKREPSLFDLVVDKAGVRPGEVVFIDDNSDNLQVARDQGWQTILFRDMAAFERELEALLKAPV